jgi:hypothetical protein
MDAEDDAPEGTYHRKASKVDVLPDFGESVHQGYLQKKSGGIATRWIKRHFVLTDKLMLRYTGADDPKSDLKGWFNLAGASTVTVDDSNSSMFTVNLTDTTALSFKGQNQQESRVWADKIRSLLNPNESMERKSLSMEQFKGRGLERKLSGRKSAAVGKVNTANLGGNQVNTANLSDWLVQLKVKAAMVDAYCTIIQDWAEDEGYDEMDDLMEEISAMTADVLIAHGIKKGHVKKMIDSAKSKLKMADGRGRVRSASKDRRTSVPKKNAQKPSLAPVKEASNVIGSYKMTLKGKQVSSGTSFIADAKHVDTDDSVKIKVTKETEDFKRERDALKLVGLAK